METYVPAKHLPLPGEISPRRHHGDKGEEDVPVQHAKLSLYFRRNILLLAKANTKNFTALPNVKKLVKGKD